MSELEFEAHLQECFEVARANAWVHVIENTWRIDPIEQAKILQARRRVKKMAEKVDKILREI